MSKPTARELSATRQAKYERRKEQGVKLIPNPWSWLTLAEVQALAVDAYKVASFGINADRGTYEFDRTYFADELAQKFAMFVAVHAAASGMSVRVVEGFRASDDKQLSRNAAQLRKKVVGWKPQYPVYQELTPAGATNASGVVTNADEGNVNGQDFIP